jgi:hypothetical protein
MTRLIGHIRANVIAYCALFVALGGTSYAAISIPKNSIGTRALRNGAVTSNKLGKGSVTTKKLDSKSIAGTVAFWARIDQSGNVIRSSEPATTQSWPTGHGVVTFRGRFSPACFPLATAGPPLGLGTVGYVSGFASPGAPGHEGMLLTMVPDGGGGSAGPLPIFVALVCPT